MASEGKRQRGRNSEERWTFPGYGEWNVVRVGFGTGETLLNVLMDWDRRSYS